MSPKLTSEFCIRQNFLLVVPPSLTQNSIKLLLIFQSLSQQYHKNMFSNFQISWNSIFQDPKKKVVFVTIQCSAGVRGNLVGHLYFLQTLEGASKFQNINFMSIGILKPKNPLQCAKSQHQQRN